MYICCELFLVAWLSYDMPSPNQEDPRLGVKHIMSCLLAHNGVNITGFLVVF